MHECLEETLTRAKLKLKLESNIFFSNVFKKLYIAIWSCMKLEDMLEVLPMLMPKKFLDEFIFIWGHEQFLKTL